jgi:uncharacterized cupredoxin-like copper-binding protein
MSGVRVASVFLLAAAVGVGGGCGGGGGNDNAKTASTGTSSTSTRPASPAAAVTVKMKEYIFIPENLEVKRGATLDVRNEGQIAHNLTIENSPDPEKPGPKLAGTPTFLPGKTEKLKVDLRPGKYSFVCTVPGHRDQGMRGRITVK